MLQEAVEQITRRVRAGFDRRDRIVEILCHEVYPTGTLSEDDVSDAIDVAIRDLIAEATTWPAVTDCDRLDSAFAAINRRDVIALQNAGYTQSDGYGDFRAALAEYPDALRIVGYCFYQGQDLERAVRGDGLYLAFGPRDAKLEATVGIDVGRIIVDEVQRVGLAVEWNGTFKQRILLPRLTWQRRVRWDQL